MNIGTFIVGFILAAIVFSPVIMSINGNKKRKSVLRKAIVAQMSKRNLKIGRIDYAGNVAIAMDENQAGLYFVNTENPEWVQELDISDITSCKKLHETRSFRTAYGMQTATAKIDLQFKLRNTGRNSIYFSLFDEENGIQLNGELQLAAQWERIINDLISGAQSIPIRKDYRKKRA